MHRILAEKSVNITELRKTQLNTLLINRLRFFLIIAPQDISLSASAFEALMDMLAEQEEKNWLRRASVRVPQD